MWFDELGNAENPGIKQLQDFVTATMVFLNSVLSSEGQEELRFRFLWEDSGDLVALARRTFAEDVVPSASALQKAIPEIPLDALNAHGLIGRPMAFKLRVIAILDSLWNQGRGQFSAREWFKKIVGTINAVLGSLIHAACGAGSLLKEFKDAVLSLA